MNATTMQGQDYGEAVTSAAHAEIGGIPPAPSSLPSDLASDRAPGSAPDLATAVFHSSASPDWGTPMIARRLAACVLEPAAFSGAIDLDYMSSAYWNLHWPDSRSRPAAYLDGSPGRDVRIPEDRARAGGERMGAGFCNPAGLDGGAMVKEAWLIFEEDHRSERMGSGFWVGFSLEQLASLQRCPRRTPLGWRDPATAKEHPDADITTIIPSRRCRYLAHPETMIRLLEEKQQKRARGGRPADPALASRIRKLLDRSDDSPVPGDSPPHASYFTILWSRLRHVRRRQQDAARSFLAAQAGAPGSLFDSVAIISGAVL